MLFPLDVDLSDGALDSLCVGQAKSKKLAEALGQVPTLPLPNVVVIR